MASKQDYKGLVTVGWVTAIVIPIIGFILGIVLVTRNGEYVRKQGTAIIVASIGMFFVWVGAVTR